MSQHHNILWQAIARALSRSPEPTIISIHRQVCRELGVPIPDIGGPAPDLCRVREIMRRILAEQRDATRAATWEDFLNT